MKILDLKVYLFIFLIKIRFGLLIGICIINSKLAFSKSNLKTTTSSEVWLPINRYFPHSVKLKFLGHVPNNFYKLQHTYILPKVV